MALSLYLYSRSFKCRGASEPRGAAAQVAQIPYSELPQRQSEEKINRRNCLLHTAVRSIVSRSQACKAASSDREFSNHFDRHEREVAAILMTLSWNTHVRSARARQLSYRSCTCVEATQ